jgi:phosphotransferase system  glucose/maltose/N-acetylglucosamine-specific IIC component
MPHLHVATLSAGYAAGGLAGLIYSAFIAAHMPRPGSEYTPVREDWIFNVILPALAYGCLIVTAVLVWRWVAQTLYVVAALSLLMLFVGIHNAWDIAVWNTVNKREAK